MADTKPHYRDKWLSVQETRVRHPKPRTTVTALPRPVRKEITTFALTLKRHYRKLFASDPLYRKRAGQFLTALLPPKPRPRGRPGRPDVTKAIKVLRQFRRQYPEERAAQHWARMYPLVISGYGNMNAVELKDARERPRERVNWRRRKKRTALRSCP
jgi:hypothetical protein